MTAAERKCGSVFASHDAGPTSRYRVLGRTDRLYLCQGCGSEAVRRGVIVLDRRLDPERPDRPDRWNVGAIGRRLLGLAR